MNLNFINQEFDRLKLLEEFITFKFEPRSRIREGKRNIYYNDLKHDFEDEVNAYGFSPFIPRTYDEQKRDLNIMRYKNKEKFNKNIMKNIKKKAEKEEIKIINYNLTNANNDKNKNSNKQNSSNGFTFFNHTARNTIKKPDVEKDNFLKKALENMGKVNMNTSADSEIFNMEKHDKISDNINNEKERTTLLSRNYIINKDLKKKKINKKLILNANDYNYYKDMKKNLIEDNEKNLIEQTKKYVDNSKWHNLENKDKELFDDLQGEPIDFYKKRMDYINKLTLNIKNNPFDYLEYLDETDTKKKFSKFIPRSANIFRERRDNFNVHLIKKFADFKNDKINQNRSRSKTATINKKLNQNKDEKVLENKFNFLRSNSQDFEIEVSREINRYNVDFRNALKITNSNTQHPKKPLMRQSCHNVFAKVTSIKPGKIKETKIKLIENEMEKNKI